MLPDVASYIKMDKGSNFVFQGILIFLILFTIFNTILMSVLERKREFAMLLALGTQPGKLRLQVLMESVFLGFIGCCLGMLLGGLASYLVNRYGEFVLLRPRFSVSNLMLWITPLLGLFAGILLYWRFMRNPGAEPAGYSGQAGLSTSEEKELRKILEEDIDS